MKARCSPFRFVCHRRLVRKARQGLQLCGTACRWRLGDAIAVKWEGEECLDGYSPARTLGAKILLHLDRVRGSVVGVGICCPSTEVGPV